MRKTPRLIPAGRSRTRWWSGNTPHKESLAKTLAVGLACFDLQASLVPRDRDSGIARERLRGVSVISRQAV
jgi:hypothetical protein